MAEDWTGIAEEVAAALDEVGFTATITREGDPSGPSWDPIDGAETIHPLTVMQDMIGFGMQSGATIQIGDVRLMAAAGATIPAQGERITVLGVDYAIMHVEPFAPGGVALFYDLILRN